MLADGGSKEEDRAAGTGRECRVMNLSNEVGKDFVTLSKNGHIPMWKIQHKHEPVEIDAISQTFYGTIVPQLFTNPIIYCHTKPGPYSNAIRSRDSESLY